MSLKYSTSINELPQVLKDMLMQANVFYTIDYQNYVESTGNIPVYIYSEQFLLLVIIQKKLIFKFAVLPTEPLILDESTQNDERQFLDECITLLKKTYSVDWIAPTLATSIFKSTPAKSVKIPFGSHIINLTQTEELLWSNVHSKHRNSIRKAEKSGVRIIRGGLELLQDYMRLDSDTWERSNKKGQSIKFYSDYVSLLKNNAVVFVAYKEKEPQSAAIFLYNSSTCYYMYGASKNHPEPGSANLLHWEAIKHMKELGVKQYSFVGCRINEDLDSKYHGIQRFKERFGGELALGYMFKVIINKWKYMLFCRMMYIKNNRGKKYPIDNIEQEKHKWINVEF